MYPWSCNTPLCRAFVTVFLACFLTPSATLPSSSPPYPHSCASSTRNYYFSRYSLANHANSCLCPLYTMPKMSPFKAWIDPCSLGGNVQGSRACTLVILFCFPSRVNHSFLCVGFMYLPLYKHHHFEILFSCLILLLDSLISNALRNTGTEFITARWFIRLITFLIQPHLPCKSCQLPLCLGVGVSLLEAYLWL